ncbi:multisubunit Na+/H+ antiporter MnhC subunit/uncharacterized MnhB-related membrane protein [Bradyrhizobium sp. LM3.2]
MSIATVFEIALAAVVLGLAIWTIAVPETYSATVGFVAYGLLVALIWVRLDAVDVALTEAAIGGGLGGVVLLGAAARLRDAEATAAERPDRSTRLIAAILSASIAAALAFAILILPDYAPTLAPAVVANAGATGMANPVTNVLMAFRGLDTMLEKVVLLLAVVGVWSLASDRAWGGRPGPRHEADPNGVLAFLARLLPRGGDRRRHLHAVDRRRSPRRSISGRCGSRVHVAAGHHGWIGGHTTGEQPMATVYPGRRALPVSCRWPRRALFRSGLPRLSGCVRQTANSRHRGRDDPHDRSDPRPPPRRRAGKEYIAMSSVSVFGLCAAAAVGLGLYGLITNPQSLRKILAFNLLGSGVFLLFGIVGRRGAAAGVGNDPVPQALVITGVVVAFSATAMAIALLLRLFHTSGSTTLGSRAPTSSRSDAPGG